VLAKLLLFGNNVEEDLFDWKLGRLKQMDCEVESFSKLIGSCTHPNITTSMITSLVRSITLYDVVKFSTIDRQPLESVKVQDLLGDITGERYCKLLNQRIEEDPSLINFLTQHGMTKDGRSIYCLALLASIPPSVLIQQLSLTTVTTGSLNIEDEIRSAYQILDHPEGKYGKGMTAIDKLKQLDKSDERVAEVLIRFISSETGDFEGWRESAAIALRCFPSM
jgi:hypothetical protein